MSRRRKLLRWLGWRALAAAFIALGFCSVGLPAVLAETPPQSLPPGAPGSANTQPGTQPAQPNGNVLPCSKDSGQTIAQDLEQQQFAVPYQDAAGCINSAPLFTAGERSSLTSILAQERDQAGDGPAQYQRFNDLVVWAITPGSGSWLFGDPAQAGGGHNPPTTAELYPIADYSPNVDAGTMLLHPEEVVPNGFAVTGTPMALQSGQTILDVDTLAFSGSFFTAGAQQVTSEVQGLYGSVFLFLVAAVIAVGVARMILEWRRGLPHLLSGAAWMLIAVVLVTLFAAAPVTFLQDANGASIGVSQLILNTAVNSDPTLAQDSTVYEPFPPQAGSISAEVPAMRIYNQAWWFSNGQEADSLVDFGQVNPTSSDGKRWLSTEVLADNALAGNDNDFNNSADLQGRPDVIDFWHGTFGGARVGYTMMLAVSLFIQVLLLGLMGLGLLMAFLGLVLIVLAFPVVGVLFVFPGKGREIAVSVLGMMGALLALRIAYSLLLAACMILTETLIPDFVGQGPWGVNVILQGVLFALVFFFLRKPVMRGVTGVVRSGRAIGSEGGQTELRWRREIQRNFGREGLMARGGMGAVPGAEVTGAAGGAGAASGAAAEGAVIGGAATGGALALAAPAAALAGFGALAMGDVKAMMGRHHNGKVTGAAMGVVGGLAARGNRRRREAGGEKAGPDGRPRRHGNAPGARISHRPGQARLEHDRGPAVSEVKAWMDAPGAPVMVKQLGSREALPMATVEAAADWPPPRKVHAKAAGPNERHQVAREAGEVRGALPSSLEPPDVL